MSHRAVFRGIGRLLQCKQGKENTLIHVSTAVDLLVIPFPVCYCQMFSGFQACSWCRALSFVLNLRHDNLDLKRVCFLALSGKVRTTPEDGTAVTLVLIDSDLLLPDAILCKNQAWGSFFPCSLYTLGLHLMLWAVLRFQHCWWGETIDSAWFFVVVVVPFGEQELKKGTAPESELFLSVFIFILFFDFDF